MLSEGPMADALLQKPVTEIVTITRTIRNVMHFFKVERSTIIPNPFDVVQTIP